MIWNGTQTGHLMVCELEFSYFIAGSSIIFIVNFCHSFAMFGSPLEVFDVAGEQFAAGQSCLGVTGSDGSDSRGNSPLKELSIGKLW